MSTERESANEGIVGEPREVEEGGLLRLGVSSCLLGREVRFDGGHKRDRFVTDVLAPYVQWVPVCPEVEVGMGTPRESLRLVQGEDGLRMVAPRSGDDWTERMNAFATRRVSELERLQLSGYVFKKDSPSCGMARVRVYRPDTGMPERNGRGLFADALIAAYPALPVEEEGRLNDADLRENFIERIFAYCRLQDLFGGGFTVGELVRFHTAHKLQIMAHSPDAYRSLGRLVAGAKAMDPHDVEVAYSDGFMGALALRATRGRNINVLEHMIGYFSKSLDARGRKELVGLVTDYRDGLIPLIVPLTLIRHFVDHYEIEYLQDQHYLQPHPKELMLRNHV